MAQSLFMKQKMMRKVIYALIPIILASIYFFGWRTLVVQAVVLIAGVGTEYVFEKKWNKPVSEAVLVTCLLYTLTLPASIPLWIAILGIIFGVIFAKEVFGGFGRNVFNPALVGRAFVYVSFPNALTIQWNAVSSGFPGGFTKYLTEPIEAITTATPLVQFSNQGEYADFLDLFMGHVAGSMGETSKVLIVFAAIYLIYTKTAAWQTMAATVAGYIASSLLLQTLGFGQVMNPFNGLLSGGILFATVFMVTDPISSASTKEGKWIFGILVGIITVIIRSFSLFAGGVMFSILISNTFVPLIDESVKMLKNRQKQVSSKEVA